MSEREIVLSLLNELNIRQAEELPADADISIVDRPAYYCDPNEHVVSLSLPLCGMQAVPDTLRGLRELRHLRLFGNVLRDLPAWFAELDRLEALYLGRNRFTEVPAPVFHLSELRVLGINANQISALAPQIENLKELRILGARDNRLTVLPKELQSLLKLSHAYLGNNRLGEIPADLFDLPKLEAVDLGSNPAKQLPKAIGNAKQLWAVDLRGGQFEELPGELFELPMLKRLSLGQVAIASLPNKVSAAKNLELLDLNRTSIGSLDKSIASLENLKVLSCSHCGLDEFPRAVIDVTSLVTLELNSNRQIRELPQEIASMSNLQVLKMAGCGLLELPTNVFRLPKLHHLDVRGNALTNIPSEVLESGLKLQMQPQAKARQPGRLLQRRKVNSQAGFFSDWSFDEEEASGIFVLDNPLQSPPVEVILAGGGAVSSYYRSSAGERRPVNEVKILLVGDGGSGKTSLTKAIMGQTFDPYESQTHGIEIRDYSYEEDGKAFIGHLWDFGGQELMHATHQFFLSRRSIYVLVLDGRKEEKTEYWLKHIETFGGTSPIIVVLNKLDENPSFEVNRKFLREKYPTISKFVRVSCKTGIGIRSLINEVRHLVGSVESASTLWPLGWFGVKRELEESNSDYIGMKEFTDVCISHGVTEVADQRTLLQFLHDLGVVLNFADLPLRDTNVINPAWITDGVYRIVNAPVLVENGGGLEISQLSELLDPIRHPPEKHNFVVELMRKFEICYEISKFKYLLPGLLPVEQPDFKPVSQECAIFRLQYEFLPKSVMPRFIVRMHDEIDERLSWRTGVVLKSREFDARALVRADEEEARIDIAVEGTQRKDYLGILIYTFRTLNRSYQGISCIEQVPLPDAPAIAVSYQHLLRLERTGEKEYFPDGASRAYRVSSLLGYVQTERRTDDEILALLKSLHEEEDSEDTLLEKARQTLVLKPTIFGVGIDLNKMVDMYFGKSKRRRLKKIKKADSAKS